LWTERNPQRRVVGILGNRKLGERGRLHRGFLVRCREELVAPGERAPFSTAVRSSGTGVSGDSPSNGPTIDALSMSTTSLPGVKLVIRAFTAERARTFLETALEKRDEVSVHRLLNAGLDEAEATEAT
jgi:hypothetical protein